MTELCKKCKATPSMSDWGFCEACVHEDCLDSLIASIRNPNQPISVCKHILNIFHDNAYFAGRSSIAFDPKLNTGIKSLSKDGWEKK